jgi:chromosome segregation protein
MEQAGDIPAAEDTAAEEATAPPRRLTATLTGLKIAGFKSFAETVQVPVLEGLTGIVGPNGCGKSNVVEALRWAMGESNARTLRGGEMDDIIFAGTATRPARNLAEVILRLEEATGVAPSPLDREETLEVIRRIERGSGSSYRINGREVRARDVQTMFADLASGPRASGMVSQGRVAALIGAKPEDRRAVLEEAAGIAGLRARRHEAELKLRQAEANLARSDDLVAQLTAQRDSLAKQAKQAARYRDISGLVRQAEGEWFAILAARAEQALLAAEEALQARQVEARAAETAANAAIAAAERAARALAAPREADITARAKLERRRVEQENLAAEEERAREALAAAEASLAQLTADLEHARKLEADAKQAAARAAGEATRLSRAIEELPAKVAAAEEAARAAEADATAAGVATERATEEAARLAAAANQIASELTFAESRAKRLADQAAQLAGERQRLEAQAIPEAQLAAAEEGARAAEAARAESEARLREAETARADAMGRAQEAIRLARAARAEQEAASRIAAAARQRREGAEQRFQSIEAEAQRLPAPLAGEAEQARTAAQQAEAALAAAEAALSEAGRGRAEAQQAAAAAREEANRVTAQQARLRGEIAGLEAAVATGSAADPIARSLEVPAGLEAALGAALGEGLDAGSAADAERFWAVLPPLADAPPLPEGAEPLGTLVGAPPALGRALALVGLAEAATAAARQAELRPGQALVSREGGLWRWDGFVLKPEAAQAGAARLQRLARLRAAQAELGALDAAGAERRRLEADATAQRAAAAEETARRARADAESAARLARNRAAEAVSRAEAAARRAAEVAERRTRAEAELAEARRAAQEAEAALAASPDANALDAARVEAERAAQAAQLAENQARQARAQADARAAGARAEQGRLTQRAAAIAAQLAALVPQEARLAAEQAEANAALDRAREQRRSLPDLAAARAEVEARRLALSEARGRETAARDAVAALRAELAASSARRDAAQAEEADWRARAADSAARVAELGQRRFEAVQAQAQLAARPAEAATRAAEAAEALLAAEREAEAARAALEAAEGAAREAEDARRAAEAAQSAAREARLLAEAARGSARQAAEALVARIAEKFGEGAELPVAAEDISDAAEERARRRAERLARERDTMGPVNLRAEVELEEIEARLSTIATDRAEIEAAIAKLRGSIGHLNREGRERLRTIFDRVDAEFRSLFSRLFGGGRAHLAMVGSDDPLEAGLEIYAEPPGKKLSALSLLSGGEQALTALSLIFAVFRCHPAPVCVLDEVDAPLDDANVERLCDLLDAMAEGGTRFLIITHHALTMARMHRLFGVTMQERGVSRLISVDLGEAVKMAEGG